MLLDMSSEKLVFRWLGIHPCSELNYLFSMPISGRVLLEILSECGLCSAFEDKIVEELTLLVFEKKNQVFLCFGTDI